MSQLTGKGALFLITSSDLWKKRGLRFRWGINCINCANKINNKNNIDNSGQAWYIIQAVAWDKTGKCLRAHGNAKNKWNFLLTNVDRNDILDKLFRTTEMIEADSEKEK